jgi:HlyD family secretion protein
MNKVLVGVLSLSAIVVISLVYSTKNKDVTVECVKVSRGDISSFIPEEGKTVLERDYTITTPVDGTVIPVDFKEGDFIKKGEIIASFDNFNRSQKINQLHSRLNELSDLTEGVDTQRTKKADFDTARLKVNEAGLNLSQADKQKKVYELEFKQSEKDYLRNKMLFNQHAVSKNDYDLAEKNYKVAGTNLQNVRSQAANSANQLKIARLALEKMQKSFNDNEFQRKAYREQMNQVKNDINIINNEVGKSNIYSEVSGPVLEVYARDKMTVPSGTRLIKIGDLQTISVQSDILSEEVPRIKTGMPVEISGKAFDNNKIIGKVSRIYPIGFTKISALGVEQQRIKVMISFDNSKLKIRPETNVDIKIITNTHKNALIVPESSIFKDKEKWYVFAIPENKLEVKEIKTGLKNEDNTEILKGLQQNDAILPETDTKLKPGAKVKCQ